MQIAEGFSGRLAVEAVVRVRLSAITLRSSELPHLGGVVGFIRAQVLLLRRYRDSP
jgi:hypothetical protein